MSRILIASNVFLFLMTAVLAWALHSRPAGPVASLDGGDATALRSPAMPDDGGAHAIGRRLDRIDSRLAALETMARQGDTDASIARAAGTEIPAAEADRQLARLLPASDIDQRQLASFHARLATLPPPQQFAVSAALSRAINEQRVRFHP